MAEHPFCSHTRYSDQYLQLRAKNPLPNRLCDRLFGLLVQALIYGQRSKLRSLLNDYKPHYSRNVRKINPSICFLQ